MVSGEDIAAIEAPKKTTAAVPKKTSSAVSKKPVSHPPYLEMIQKGIKHLKERGGSSRQAILKYVMANYTVGDHQASINARVKTALKNGVKLGSLTQSKGTGASGSFRIADGKKRTVKPKKTVTKAKKTVKSQKKVKKPKAAKRSKSASPRKSIKKTVKSRKTAKSPLKKRSKVAKPKKTKSPKKKATKSRRAY